MYPSNEDHRNGVLELLPLLRTGRVCMFLVAALKIIKDSFIYLIYHKDLRIKLTKINDFIHVICMCVCWWFDV